MKREIQIIIIIIVGLLMITGCGKESKLQTAISKSEKAIKQFQNDEITMRELGEKLENASDYCKSYEDTDEDWGSLLCTNISLYSYEASMSAVSNDGIDYKYWDKALMELNEYRSRVK